MQGQLFVVTKVHKAKRPVALVAIFLNPVKNRGVRLPEAVIFAAVNQAGCGLNSWEFAYDNIAFRG